MKMFCNRRNKKGTPFLFTLAILLVAASLLFAGSAFARSVMEPVNPTPEDGETGVPTDVILYWELEAVVENPQSYDVYFGTDPDPLYFGSTGDIEYSEPGDLYMDVGELEEGETYYWRVVAHYYGDDMTSSTWSFKTEDSSSGCNTGILNPLFLLLLAPVGLLLRKSR
jgi:Synergist-CTERM protein sorting domain-containing protein